MLGGIRTRRSRHPPRERTNNDREYGGDTVKLVTIGEELVLVEDSAEDGDWIKFTLTEATRRDREASDLAERLRELEDADENLASTE